MVVAGGGDGAPPRRAAQPLAVEVDVGRRCRGADGHGRAGDVEVDEVVGVEPVARGDEVPLRRRVALQHQGVPFEVEDETRLEVAGVDEVGAAVEEELLPPLQGLQRLRVIAGDAGAGGVVEAAGVAARQRIPDAGELAGELADHPVGGGVDDEAHRILTEALAPVAAGDDGLEVVDQGSVVVLDVEAGVGLGRQQPARGCRQGLTPLPVVLPQPLVETVLLLGGQPLELRRLLGRLAPRQAVAAGVQDVEPHRALADLRRVEEELRAPGAVAKRRLLGERHQLGRPDDEGGGNGEAQPGGADLDAAYEPGRERQLLDRLDRREADVLVAGERLRRHGQHEGGAVGGGHLQRAPRRGDELVDAVVGVEGDLHASRTAQRREVPPRVRPGGLDVQAGAGAGAAIGQREVPGAGVEGAGEQPPLAVDGAPVDDAHHQLGVARAGGAKGSGAGDDGLGNELAAGAVARRDGDAIIGCRELHRRGRRRRPLAARVPEGQQVACRRARGTAGVGLDAPGHEVLEGEEVAAGEPWPWRL